MANKPIKQDYGLNFLGLDGVSKQNLNQVIKEFSKVLKPFAKELGIKISQSSFTSVKTLTKLFADLNAQVTTTGRNMQLTLSGKKGVSGTLKTSYGENGFTTLSKSYTSSKPTPTKELTNLYNELYKAQKKVYSLELKGDTESASYKKATQNLKEYENQIKSFVKEKQKMYNLTVDKSGTIKGRGALAQTQRMGQAKLTELNVDKQLTELNVDKQSAQNYLSKLRQIHSAEADLARMKTEYGKDVTSAQGKAIQSQKSYIDVLKTQGQEQRKQIENSQAYKDILPQISTEEARSKAQIDKLNAGIREQTGLFGNFRETLKRVARERISNALFTMAYEGMRQAINTSKELNKSLVDIQIVTNGTQESAQKLLDTYNGMAIQLGSTTREVANASIEWLRQGYDVADTNELVKDSMVLSKVGAIDSANATQYLTSALKGYKLEATDAMTVVDKLTSLDLVAATSSGDLAEAMSRTATSANIAGVSMDKLLSYITVVAETTQKSASSVGESFKTIFARFGNIKAGNFVSEDGENLSDVQKVLAKFDIQLYDTQGNMNNLADIIDTVASKWGNLTDVERNALATAIAGTRQRENFLSRIGN